MKRFVAIIALALPVAMAAQTGIVAEHQANDEGRYLTMEDAVIGRGLTPAVVRASWIDNETYGVLSQGKWSAVDAKSGSVSEYVPKKSSVNLPEEARNVEANEDGVLAYTIGQSLYINDGVQKCVAESESDQITYGQTVSRNEFGINGGIFWSPNGSRIAFYRKDESRVTDFPLLDITTRTGTLKNIKYPMNGMESEEVRLGIYDLRSGTTVWCDVTDFGIDRYLTNISWSPDDRNIFIQVLDRSQKHMKLNMYRASDGSFVRTLLNEEGPRYVEPEDPIRFLKGTYSFIYRINTRDGYRNLYLCDTLGSVRRLTKVDADVAYVANNGRSVFYTSAEVSTAENHLFRIDLKIAGRSGTVTIGSPVRLTNEEGWHKVQMNEDCTKFIDTFSSFNVPSETILKTASGKVIRNLGTAEDPLKDIKTGKIVLGTVRSADGKFDNWYRLYYPSDFDASKKYPVLLYVYGGPHSQMVQNRWLGGISLWEEMMAQKGYIVYVQDNRGTSNFGAEYEKAIHRQCGQAEMADQMEGINMLKSLPFVDSDRIGVYGWSYGGFMTISLMTNYPETFKAGVAGGPVIDWKWYEAMYGERYMETEATNPEGFRKTSLINNADKLKGRLLICQGAVDNTVVWEHSLSFVQTCIERDVQLDYFPYPCSEHNVYGRWRIHLMEKITNYLDENLQRRP